MTIESHKFIYYRDKMKILIFTEPDDRHAVFVKYALETNGHHVRLMFTADQPLKQKNSVFMCSASYKWTSSDEYDSFSDNDYDAVWWRRPRKPYLPKDATHPEDHKFVKRENVFFYESLIANVAPNAWWVNTKESATKATSKLFQLRLAAEIGLVYPETLCSNNPKDIREFVSKYESSGIIYKPMCTNFWLSDGVVRTAYTAKITSALLPEPKILQLSPGIFQKEIKKQYELRVTCFGDHIVAAKLPSQRHPDGQIDWRIIPPEQMIVEPYTLPLEIEHKIKIFMNKIGLVFCAFDFIVTPDNDYIFLEVNEQGQFLWIEECNPEFKMLDMFVNFITNQSSKFKWNPQNLRVEIGHYRTVVGQTVSQNMDRHVELNNLTTYNE